MDTISKAVKGSIQNQVLTLFENWGKGKNVQRERAHGGEGLRDQDCFSRSTYETSVLL